MLSVRIRKFVVCGSSGWVMDTGIEWAWRGEGSRDDVRS